MSHYHHTLNEAKETNLHFIAKFLALMKLIKEYDDEKNYRHFYRKRLPLSRIEVNKLLMKGLAVDIYAETRLGGKIRPIIVEVIITSSFDKQFLNRLRQIKDYFVGQNPRLIVVTQRRTKAYRFMKNLRSIQEDVEVWFVEDLCKEGSQILLRLLKELAYPTTLHIIEGMVPPDD